jgi:hypothetical protein
MAGTLRIATRIIMQNKTRQNGTRASYVFANLNNHPACWRIVARP